MDIGGSGEGRRPVQGRMIERALFDVLYGSLGRYLDLSRKQFNVRMWQGVLRFKDVAVRADALDEAELPLRVVSGVIGEMTVTVPWNRIWKDPIVLTIAGLTLFVAPKRPGEMDGGESVGADDGEDKAEVQEAKAEAEATEAARKVEERAQANKQAKLAAAEMLKMSGSKETEAPSGLLSAFFRVLGAKLLDNLEVEIRGVHVQYCDPRALAPAYAGGPRRGLSVGLRIKALSAVTTDGEWNKAAKGAMPRTSGDIVFKLFEVEDVSIYWEASTAGEHRASPAGAEWASLVNTRNGQGEEEANVLPEKKEKDMVAAKEGGEESDRDKRKGDVDWRTESDSGGSVLSGRGDGRMGKEHDSLLLRSADWVSHHGSIESPVCEDTQADQIIDHHWILYPTGLILVRIAWNRLPEVRRGTAPAVTISVKVGKLRLAIDDAMVRDALAIGEGLESLVLQAKYTHLRPRGAARAGPRSNPRAWWAYAINAVVEENGLRDKLWRRTSQYHSWRREKRLKYVAAYRSKLRLLKRRELRMPKDMEDTLGELERELDFETILIFRTFAEHDEAREEPAGSSTRWHGLRLARDVMGMLGSGGYAFPSYLRPAGTFGGGDGAVGGVGLDGEEVKEVTKKEVDNFYEAIGFDPSVVRGDKIGSPPELRNVDVKVDVKVDVSVQQFGVVFSECRKAPSLEFDDVARLDMLGIEISLSLSDTFLTIKVEVADAFVEDLCTPGALHPLLLCRNVNIHERGMEASGGGAGTKSIPIVKVRFVKNPLDRPGVGLAMDVGAAPIRVVCATECVFRLMSILIPPSNPSVTIRALQLDSASRLGSLAARLSAKLEWMAEYHVPTHVRVEGQALHILIPDNSGDVKGEVLNVAVGKFSIESMMDSALGNWGEYVSALRARAATVSSAASAREFERDVFYDNFRFTLDDISLSTGAKNDGILPPGREAVERVNRSSLPRTDGSVILDPCSLEISAKVCVLTGDTSMPGIIIFATAPNVNVSLRNRSAQALAKVLQAFHTAVAEPGPIGVVARELGKKRKLEECAAQIEQGEGTCVSDIDDGEVEIHRPVKLLRGQVVPSCGMASKATNEPSQDSFHGLSVSGTSLGSMQLTPCENHNPSNSTTVTDLDDAVGHLFVMDGEFEGGCDNVRTETPELSSPTVESAIFPYMIECEEISLRDSQNFGATHSNKSLPATSLGSIQSSAGSKSMQIEFDAVVNNFRMSFVNFPHYSDNNSTEETDAQSAISLDVADLHIHGFSLPTTTNFGVFFSSLHVELENKFGKALPILDLDSFTASMIVPLESEISKDIFEFPEEDFRLRSLIDLRLHAFSAAFDMEALDIVLQFTNSLPVQEHSSKEMCMETPEGNPCWIFKLRNLCRHSPCSIVQAHIDCVNFTASDGMGHHQVARFSLQKIVCDAAAHVAGADVTLILKGSLSGLSVEGNARKERDYPHWILVIGSPSTRLPRSERAEESANLVKVSFESTHCLEDGAKQTSSHVGNLSIALNLSSFCIRAHTGVISRWIEYITEIGEKLAAGEFSNLFHVRDESNYPVDGGVPYPPGNESLHISQVSLKVSGSHLQLVLLASSHASVHKSDLLDIAVEISEFKIASVNSDPGESIYSGEEFHAGIGEQKFALFAPHAAVVLVDTAGYKVQEAIFELFGIEGRISESFVTVLSSTRPRMGIVVNVSKIVGLLRTETVVRMAIDCAVLEATAILRLLFDDAAPLEPFFLQFSLSSLNLEICCPPECSEVDDILLPCFPAGALSTTDLICTYVVMPSAAGDVLSPNSSGRASNEARMTSAEKNAYHDRVVTEINFGKIAVDVMVHQSSTTVTEDSKCHDEKVNYRLQALRIDRTDDKSQDGVLESSANICVESRSSLFHSKARSENITLQRMCVKCGFNSDVADISDLLASISLLSQRGRSHRVNEEEELGTSFTGIQRSIALVQEICIRAHHITYEAILSNGHFAVPERIATDRMRISFGIHVDMSLLLEQVDSIPELSQVKGLHGGIEFLDFSVVTSTRRNFGGVVGRERGKASAMKSLAILQLPHCRAEFNALCHQEIGDGERPFVSSASAEDVILRCSMYMGNVNFCFSPKYFSAYVQLIDIPVAVSRLVSEKVGNVRSSSIRRDRLTDGHQNSAIHGIRFEVKMDGFRLLLVDDQQTQHAPRSSEETASYAVPLVVASAAAFTANAQISSQKDNLMASLTSQVSVEYHNISSSLWEPGVEEFKVEIFLNVCKLRKILLSQGISLDMLSRDSSSAEVADDLRGVVSVHISATTVNINMTEAFFERLTQVSQVLAAFSVESCTNRNGSNPSLSLILDGSSKKEKDLNALSSSTTSVNMLGESVAPARVEVSSIKATPDHSVADVGGAGQQESSVRYIPLILRNECGSDVECTMAGQGSIVTVPARETLSYPVYWRDKVNRPELLVRIEGPFLESPPLRIDKPGSYAFPLSHLPGGGQQDSIESSGIVLVETGQNGNTVTFSSSMRIRNNFLRPFEFCIQYTRPQGIWVGPGLLPPPRGREKTDEPYSAMESVDVVSDGLVARRQSSASSKPDAFGSFNSGPLPPGSAITIPVFVVSNLKNATIKFRPSELREGATGESDPHAFYWSDPRQILQLVSSVVAPGPALQKQTSALAFTFTPFTPNSTVHEPAQQVFRGLLLPERSSAGLWTISICSPLLIRNLLPSALNFDVRSVGKLSDLLVKGYTNSCAASPVADGWVHAGQDSEVLKADVRDALQLYIGLPLYSVASSPVLAHPGGGGGTWLGQEMNRKQEELAKPWLLQRSDVGFVGDDFPSVLDDLLGEFSEENEESAVSVPLSDFGRAFRDRLYVRRTSLRFYRQSMAGDGKGGPLDIQLECIISGINGAMSISVSCPCWIYNLTGLGLVLQDEDSGTRQLCLLDQNADLTDWSPYGGTGPHVINQITADNLAVTSNRDNCRHSIFQKLSGQTELNGLHMHNSLSSVIERDAMEARGQDGHADWLTAEPLMFGEESFQDAQDAQHFVLGVLPVVSAGMRNASAPSNRSWSEAFSLSSVGHVKEIHCPWEIIGSNERVWPGDDLVDQSGTGRSGRRAQMQMPSATAAKAPANRRQIGAFAFGVGATLAPGRCNKFSRVISIVPRFVIVNDLGCGRVLQIQQRGATGGVLRLNPGERAPFHWFSANLRRLICIRIENEGWTTQWSGGVDIGRTGDISLRLRRRTPCAQTKRSGGRRESAGPNESHGMEVSDLNGSIARIEVRAGRGICAPSHFIIVSENGRGNKQHSPFRIDNFTMEMLRYRQQGSDYWDVLSPYQSRSYAWDEPLGYHRLEVERIGGSRIGTFSFQALGAQSTIRSFGLAKLFLGLHSRKREPVKVLVRADGPTRVLCLYGEGDAEPGIQPELQVNNLSHLFDLKVSADFAHFGVSALHTRPFLSELAYFSVERLHVSVSQEGRERRSSIRAHTIQLDDQRLSSRRPVVLFPDRGDRSGDDDAGECMLRLNVDQFMVGESLVHIKLFDLQLQPFHLYIEESFALEAQQLFERVTSTALRRHNAYTRMTLGNASASSLISSRLGIETSTAAQPSIPSNERTLSLTPGTRGARPDETLSSAPLISLADSDDRYPERRNVHRDGLYTHEECEAAIDLTAGWVTRYGPSSDSLHTTLKRIYFEHLRIGSVGFSLTVFLDARPHAYGATGVNPLRLWMFAMGRSLVRLENAAISFPSLSMDHPFVSQDELLARLMQHYLGQAYLAISAAALSIDLVGNAGAVARAMWHGLKDFVTSPLAAIAQAPEPSEDAGMRIASLPLSLWRFAVGSTRGTLSLTQHSIYAWGTFLGKIGSQTAILISQLSLDPAYAALVANRKRTGPNGLRISSRAASGSLLLRAKSGTRDRSLDGPMYALFAGAGGLLQEVCNALDRLGSESPFAIAVGLGRGLIGVFVKPLVGILDTAARAAEAMRDCAMPDRGVSRCRPPRVLHRPGLGYVLSAFDLEQALGHERLRLLEGGRFAKERFVAFIDLGSTRGYRNSYTSHDELADTQGSRLTAEAERRWCHSLIITTRYLIECRELHTRSRGTSNSEPELLWVCPFRYVLSAITADGKPIAPREIQCEGGGMEISDPCLAATQGSSVSLRILYMTNPFLYQALAAEGDISDLSGAQMQHSDDSINQTPSKEDAITRVECDGLGELIAESIPRRRTQPDIRATLQPSSEQKWSAKLDARFAARRTLGSAKYNPPEQGVWERNVHVFGVPTVQSRCLSGFSVVDAHRLVDIVVCNQPHDNLI